MDNTPTRAARRINLSYILHEPSDSASVAQYLALVEREENRVARLMSRLNSLNDDELRQRVVRRERAAETDSPTAERVVMLSLRLGAWTLVERLFRITDASSRYQGVPWLAQTLDVATSAQAAVTLFRGSAWLAIPDEPVAAGSEIWLVVAPVRPGGTSLHLESIYLARSTDEASRAWLQMAIPWLETILREHPTQWFADRPLWLDPVESSRPEFKQGSGHG